MEVPLIADDEGAGVLVSITTLVTIGVMVSDELDDVGRVVAADEDEGGAEEEEETELELEVGRVDEALELARVLEAVVEAEDVLRRLVVSSSSSSSVGLGRGIRGTRVTKVEVNVVSLSLMTVVVVTLICLFSKALLW